MAKDIRHKEIKIKVKETECCLDAIKRYLKKKRFTHFIKTTLGNLKHDMFYSDDYYEIWVANQSFSESTNKCTFVLDGNR